MGKCSSGGGAGGKTQNNTITANTKFTAAQIKSMRRSDLETVARAVFIKQNTARGLTASEADRRARSMMSGNTDAQLRKYIKKYG